MCGISALVSTVDGGTRPGLVGIVDCDDAIADRQPLAHRKVHQAARTLATDIVIVRGLAADDAAQRHEAIVAAGRERNGAGNLESTGHDDTFRYGAVLLDLTFGAGDQRIGDFDVVARLDDQDPRAADTVDLLKRHGLDCDIVGGAGTGTFELELASGIYTELQAGSYCFMDADYARNRGGESAGFKHALFVLGTVMSQTRSGAAVTDVGHKAVAVDSGLPTVWQRPDIAFTGASDEHGQLSWEAGDGVQLGDKLRLVPGHCDPTVDRYDWYVGVRKGRVECLWPVAARGAFY